MNVQFYCSCNDANVSHIAIVARIKDKWLLCQSKNQYGIPSGKREAQESTFSAAGRILREETGASAFTLIPVCAYSVEEKGESEFFGMLYFAKIENLSETGRADLALVGNLPISWTDPTVQLPFLEKIQDTGLVRIAG